MMTRGRGRILLSRLVWLSSLAGILVAQSWAGAQTLEAQLAAEDQAALAEAVRTYGDARRGAIVFHQPSLACARCHLPWEGQPPLGPELTRLGTDVTDVHLVEALLAPSKTLRKGYEPVNLVLTDGRTTTALLVKDEPDKLTVRDMSRSGATVEFAKTDIDQLIRTTTSIMPAGQVNQLAGRQQFLDLVKYLSEIRDGGPDRAAMLAPPANLLGPLRLPEYEERIDHAGLLASLDDEAYQRGAAIYNRLCINCHGTHDQPGSLPTSLRFAAGQFKNGADPLSMYRTLTRGFGMMTPQTWMVPQQKYDVIHYIREDYLRSRNPSQYVELTPEYLANLPPGDTRGPAPVEVLEWERMDYGRNLIATYEVGDTGRNFAYKGNAIRLDSGAGGVSRGRQWMLYDYDTLRVAAAWSGNGFIDWNGINFNGRHGIHPRLVGDVIFETPSGPGWARPGTDSFADEDRVVGRDGRRYGPLPRSWAHYRGMYQHGSDVVIKYSVGTTDVLEWPRLSHQLPFDALTAPSAEEPVSSGTDAPAFERVFNIGSRREALLMRVAHAPQLSPQEAVLRDEGAYVVFGRDMAGQTADSSHSSPRPAFHGSSYCEFEPGPDWNLDSANFTITARVRTGHGGTILCETAVDKAEWVPDGKTLFIRGGRLCFDIGWVGVVQSRRRVDDRQWHDVALTHQAETDVVRLYIDGKFEAQATLAPKNRLTKRVVRVGYTAEDFPRPASAFQGEIAELGVWQRILSDEELTPRPTVAPGNDAQLAHWLFDGTADVVKDRSGHGRDLNWKSPSQPARVEPRLLVAELSPRVPGATFEQHGTELRLRLPAGEQPLQFALRLSVAPDRQAARSIHESRPAPAASLDLSPLLAGGPSRWPERLTTQSETIGASDGPFAVDVLTHPAANPWFCRMRLTGFDFYPDGDRAAVCDWDGNVWIVSGLSALERRDPSQSAGPVPLVWKRIASGMFQPLGLLLREGVIHITCRDELCRLHDLNGDEEIDFYENLNNDHQVTEHFHEFAMGLQVDAEGNFYYAKSARHALTAVVPHHGTLLRVSPDGARTEILATGFRAANGVCLNPDGTFFVTDQEGHWTPKNRVNWVREGGFYGNMFGYHDVEDSSDEAMEQPLCWITNAFDRSPAELLWVTSERWGPLQGALLNFSYGYGKMYVVPHERVGDRMQGGMQELPIGPLPTGVMRGRFSPVDGQLYACGMFAWAGTQEQPGGFYRVRYTGRPAHAVVQMSARTDGLALTFSEPLNATAAAEVARYELRAWSLRRSANYGSDHHDTRQLPIKSARLLDDRRTVLLDVPDLAPTWCMEIQFALVDEQGQSFQGKLHNTIHELVR